VSCPKKTTHHCVHHPPWNRRSSWPNLMHCSKTGHCPAPVHAQHEHRQQHRQQQQQKQKQHARALVPNAPRPISPARPSSRPHSAALVRARARAQLSGSLPTWTAKAAARSHGCIPARARAGCPCPRRISIAQARRAAALAQPQSPPPPVELRPEDAYPRQILISAVRARKASPLTDWEVVVVDPGGASLQRRPTLAWHARLSICRILILATRLEMSSSWGRVSSLGT
jgi:hypothetical protein